MKVNKLIIGGIVLACISTALFLFLKKSKNKSKKDFILSVSKITDADAKNNFIESLDKMNDEDLKVFYDFLKLQSSGAEVSNDVVKKASEIAVKYTIKL